MMLTINLEGLSIVSDLIILEIFPKNQFYFLLDANLPEVVRTPSNYRSATARYASNPMNDYYYNNYDRDDYHTRTAKAIYNRDIPSSTTMRIASTPVRADTIRDSIRERSYYG
jgi:hypothetical protein